MATLLSACAGDPSVFTSKPAGINKAYAIFSNAAKHEQCVPYARRVSGIQLRGDAHSWWQKASQPQRHERPQKGAVMVLAKTRRLRFGHLAVVMRVINQREIEVSHTNWGYNQHTRQRIYHLHRVRDVSEEGDWSSAIFWNPDSQAFGSPYLVSGFIWR